MPQKLQFVRHFAQLPFSFFGLEPPFYAENWHHSSYFSPLEHYHTAKVFALFMLFVSDALPPLYAPPENNFPKMCGYLVNPHAELF